MTDDPLVSLISNEANEVDRRRLAEFLKPFVKIDQGLKTLSFLDQFHDCENKKKIEIILAAAKARALLFNETDGLFPVDVIDLDVMPKGSVKSSLKSLYDNHKIKKDHDGRYFLPAYRIPELTKSYNL